MIPFHEESAAPSAPQGLIAYREDGGDVLCWQAVVNAAGYYVYARKNTADDNNYAHFEYERQNQTPLDSCEWVGESREVSYRVTAVDAQGRESGFRPSR